MSRSLGVEELVVRDPLPRGGGWREEQRMGGNSELRPVLEHARRSGEVGGYFCSSEPLVSVPLNFPLNL